MSTNVDKGCVTNAPSSPHIYDWDYEQFEINIAVFIRVCGSPGAGEMRSFPNDKFEQATAWGAKQAALWNARGTK
jgi:hypothetical protein